MYFASLKMVTELAETYSSHSVYILIPVYLCALASTTIVPIRRAHESSVHFTVVFYCALLQYVRVLHSIQK
jgi:hypothetical protein